MSCTRTEEVEVMVSQNAIPSRQHLGGSLPYVFTEHGILQLANVLKSGRATQMSIKHNRGFCEDAPNVNGQSKFKTGHRGY